MDTLKTVKTPASIGFAGAAYQFNRTLVISLEVPMMSLPNMVEIGAQSNATNAAHERVELTKQKQKFDYTFKFCQEFEDEMAEGSAEHVLIPAIALTNYFEQVQKRKIDFRTIKTSLIQEPKHGELVASLSNTGYQVYSYYSEPGYLGKDSAVFEAELNGKRYKITTELRVVRLAGAGADCPPARLIKVSQILPAPSDYKITFSDLAGTAVGQTQGEGSSAQITLDNNAAGHGWFIDATPDNNEEFLPTSDPEVWIAKAGTAAAGKMDLLSVLLHEYGHALGIEHSSDHADYMAASLQLGERRLPSRDELSLMSRLVAALKGETAGSASGSQGDDPQSPSPDPWAPLASIGLLALGRVRRSDYGWTLNLGQAQLNPRYEVASLTQHETAIQATLSQADQDWQSAGQATVQNGHIALSESATAHAQATQSFALKQGDRYLSFTVDNKDMQSNGIDEDGNETGPDDAFEVALLNANTGLSVAGNDGLSHSDALLNIQSDGTEHCASSVRKESG